MTRAKIARAITAGATSPLLTCIVIAAISAAIVLGAR